MAFKGAGTHSQPPYANPNDGDDDSVLDFEETADGDPPKRRKRWWDYLPLCLLLLILFGPHISVFHVLVFYFLKSPHLSPLLFILNMSIIYLLTFLACCSLIVLLVRDPGAVRIEEATMAPSESRTQGMEPAEGDMTVTEALLNPAMTNAADDEDFNSPLKWCRKCWAPKPERTHHCSVCKRCVLKMDHHCPWLAQNCVGHWTYPAFLHFLFCVTLLAAYISILSCRVTYVAFIDPFSVDEWTAINALFCTLYGAIFALTVGSFLSWHLYLVTTNQTSLETLSPFLLLRYLPNNPVHQVQDRSATSFPGPQAQVPRSEHQLSGNQRRHVRFAHDHIRLYDVGWRRNWLQVIGVKPDTMGLSWRRIAYRILCGGGGYGDGKAFPRNPRADTMLARLAAQLLDEDKLH